MRALIQRVAEARCVVSGQVTGACEQGYLILLGVGLGDDVALAERLWNKIWRLRIFEDEAGKTNRSLADVGGSVLVVSQFTLYADCSHGNRPGFTDAARPDVAIPVYEAFCAAAERDLGHTRVGRGIFGADMQVTLTNSGPFTVWLDTAELFGV